MKKRLIIIIAIIVIALVVAFAYAKTAGQISGGKNNNSQVSTADGITTLLTLEDEIQDNSIWCGTFQLIWNDLKNDLAKQDIKFTPQLQVVENLNKETFTTDDISEKYYYKKIGYPSYDLKQEIEKAIKDKFNETSNILDDFDWEDHDPEDYFLYAMLKKNLNLKKLLKNLKMENLVVMMMSNILE